MHPDRRRFLQLCAASGLGLAARGLLLGPRARAAEAWPGPFLLTIHADGGWDPMMLCDPKGLQFEDEPDPVSTAYMEDEIEEVGPFRVAPLGRNVDFFERFRDDVLVINGLDAQTNSHDTGTRHTWSGTIDPGAPALAALYAGAAAPRPTLSFLSNGGYDQTGGVVPPTRIPDIGAIEELAWPDRITPDDPASTLYTAATLERLRAARTARIERQRAAATLPRWERAYGLLNEARTGDDELAALTAYLPTSLDNTSNLRRQAQVAMACFRAGVSVSATLSTGGFDTHGNHDASHTGAMNTLMDGVLFAMDEAERQGIADDLIVLVGSDFGRTPWYNDGNGKDHWPITSMMLMGPGIRGGRVIGSTDRTLIPLGLDPDTLQTAADGIRLTPAHVHAALRDLLALTGHPVTAGWDVGTALPLLG